MNKFEEYNSHLNAIRKLVKESGSEMVTGFFETLFAEHPNMDVALVYGYTPGFNDGDPCSHTQYCAFDAEEINDTFDFYDYFGDLDIDEDEVDDLTSKLNSKLQNKEAYEVERKIDDVEELLERVYGTDFYLCVLRKEDGTIEINEGDYDCGY